MDRDRQRKLRSAVCEELRLRRLGAGLRQEAVAALLHRPQSFVSKYESGVRRLDLTEIMLICAALKVDVRDFLTSVERRAGEG